MSEVQAVAGGHPDMDYAEHDRTYVRFVKMTKWGIIFLVLLLIFMAVTLL
jgi:hypothetical protein